MASLDWFIRVSLNTHAPLRRPGTLSTAGHCPVSTVFENLECGATIEEIMEWFDVTREQIVAVLEFAARSLDAPPPAQVSSQTVDAHSL